MVFGSTLFWNESQKIQIESFENAPQFPRILHQGHYFFFQPFPAGVEKICGEAIQARCFIFSHLINNILYLFHLDGFAEYLVVVLRDELGDVA